MIFRKILIFAALVVAVMTMTGASRIATSPVGAPELQLKVKTITNTKPVIPVIIYWDNEDKGIYKTEIGPGKTKNYLVINGNYSNVIFENYN